MESDTREVCAVTKEVAQGVWVDHVCWRGKAQAYMRSVLRLAGATMSIWCLAFWPSDVIACLYRPCTGRQHGSCQEGLSAAPPAAHLEWLPCRPPPRHHLPEQSHQEVPLAGALVHLVHHNAAGAGQLRVASQPPEQDACSAQRAGATS